jgi:hypothetical protein
MRIAITLFLLFSSVQDEHNAGAHDIRRIVGCEMCLRRELSNGFAKK